MDDAFNVGVYQCSKYKAYIYPTFIVICTNLQCIRITFDKYYLAPNLDMVKLAILNNELDDISDILDMTNVILKVNPCNKPSVLA